MSDAVRTRIGKDRLVSLTDRLRTVNGELAMSGLLTWRGRAPLSPLGYALLMPEFKAEGLTYKDRFFDHETSGQIIPFGCVRYYDPVEGKNRASWVATAVFFGISIDLAQHFFTSSPYEEAWAGDRTGRVPVTKIVERLDKYLTATPDLLFGGA